MVTYSQIQHPPLKGEKPFQDFCLKLLRHEWDDPYATLHGRTGQRQQGADITGTDRRGNYKIAACQCKASDRHQFRKLTLRELTDEVELAKSFIPRLDIYIIAYAGERDAKLQEKARELDASNSASGLFKIALWSWDDIVERAEKYPEVRGELYIQDGYLEITSALDPKRVLSGTDIVSSLSTVTDQIQTRIFTDESRQVTSSEVDAVAEAKLDIFRDQIRAGNGSAAINPLRSFIAELEPDANPHIRFRAYANLGAALDQCDQSEQAISAFEEAARAEPATAASHAYKARALFARDLISDAYKEANVALAIDPEQRLAAGILIDTAPEAVTTADLEQRLSPNVCVSEVAISLAGRYSREGQHDDAIRIAQAMEPQHMAALRDAAIAQAILHKFDDNIEVRLGIASTEIRTLIIEARDLLEGAWQWAKARSDKMSWTYMAANLVVAYRLNGQEAEADELALQAYEIEKESPALREHAIVALLHKGDRQMALEIAIQCTETGSGRAALLAAEIAGSLSDWPALERWAERAFTLATNDADRARAAERIVLATYRCQTADDALKRADDLRRQFSTSIAFEARVAEVARRAGDKAALDAAEERLNAFEPTTLNTVERVELAGARADAGDWDKAANLLEGLYSLDHPSELLRDTLFYLYRADLRSKARGLYESLRGEALKSKEILRLGAAIYEKAGLLPQALNALKAAIGLDQKDLGSRLDWARLCLRSNDEQSVSQWVRTASNISEGSPEELLEFAQLLDRYSRRQDALSLGYKALRDNWGTSERAHLMYMSLFLLHPGGDAFLSPTSADIDTVVFLESNHGVNTHYLIETDAAPATNVLRPDSSFAQRLIGKRVGDILTINESIGQPVSWKITQIKHKYLDLFHTAMEAHESTFPGSTALGRFHIDPGEEKAFEPLFEQVRERARFTAQVTAAYKDSLIPVDAIATLLGIDVIDASLGLRFQSDIKLDSCIGTQLEREQAMMQIQGASEILVDALTLSIWQEIGLLEELENIREFDVLVVQATIDVLTERYEAMQRDIHQEGGSLEVHGEKVVFAERNKERRAANVEQCKYLLLWVHSKAKLIPTEPLTSFEEVSSVLSHSAIAVLGTAIETQRPAIIEDRRLRMLASSLGAPKMGWTQVLLMDWLENEKISRSTYSALVAKLHEWRIGFISASSQDLLILTEHPDGYSLFDSLISALSISSIEHTSLEKVAVSFISDLWIAPKYQKNKTLLTNKMLDVVLCRSNGIDLLRRTLRGVYDQIVRGPMPMQFVGRMWADHVERYLRGHFILGIVTRPPTII